ncbi:transcriptional regulator, LacI family [Solimonas aquatica]|uniref:Transcriptional regulator, LacI family n=1 Tax=Solimonas aquatica TaxID=489703 RepID=A0A1H9AQZ6_9GAMM|nr:LacI family DNA-binding transcriptional regulator [Solimonas aquatica]SEP78803.1 transcriptional regulator, LacI family [Solimonas aquatica]
MPDKSSKREKAQQELPAASRRLQMADIARMAGVSVSTVSRALAGSQLINEQTRQRIADLARSLNYSINAGAQSLRTRQNRTVAVVVPLDSATRQHVSDPFFLSMVGSLADALTERGYDMLLSRVDAEHLDAVSRLYDTGRAVGIIMIGQWLHHDQLNAMALRRLPVVVWGAQLPQQLYCTVGGDNVLGGALATAHLLERGRRRIAFFGDARFPEVAQRLEGFLLAHQRAGLTVPEQLKLSVAFAEDSARAALKHLLDAQIAFDAVFACSDLLAMTVINGLRAVGKRVPDDVAVTGYDDIELARYFHPELSTVRQPVVDAGRALVDQLLKIVAGETPESVMLPTELVVRATS